MWFRCITWSIWEPIPVLNCYLNYCLNLWQTALQYDFRRGESSDSSRIESIRRHFQPCLVTGWRTFSTSWKSASGMTFHIKRDDLIRFSVSQDYLTANWPPEDRCFLLIHIAKDQPYLSRSKHYCHYHCYQYYHYHNCETLVIPFPVCIAFRF